VPKNFTYDAVYDWNSTQRAVYDQSAFPLVESVLEGYNGTIFAYGQTGCGKSHTMMGYKSSPEDRGIIPNAFYHIFGFID
jgi:kinesin family protein 3/17